MGKRKRRLCFFNGKVLSPLNLKFVDSGDIGFVNWNMQTPLFRGEGLLSDYEESDSLVFESLLSEAADNMFLIKPIPVFGASVLFHYKRYTHILFRAVRKRHGQYERQLIFFKEFLKRGKNSNVGFTVLRNRKKLSTSPTMPAHGTCGKKAPYRWECSQPKQLSHCTMQHLSYATVRRSLTALWKRQRS